jgi:carbonic anhydrase
MQRDNAHEILSTAPARVVPSSAAELGSRPRRGLAVLTCMDARIDPLALLGLQHGDAHVIRNAGGLASDDAIRSLSVSQRVLGTDEVIVVMHQGCGLLGASDEDFAIALAADGASPPWRLGAFADLDAALLENVERLRNAPELPARHRIRGFVFDPASGLLREAVPA